MSDLVERLRVWPAAYGEDAMSSTYVGKMSKDAADEIEKLRNQLGKALTALKDISQLYAGVHGYRAVEIAKAALSDEKST